MINAEHLKVIAARVTAASLVVGLPATVMLTYDGSATKVKVQVHGFNPSGNFVASGKAKNGFDSVWVFSPNGKVIAENQSPKSLDKAVEFALSSKTYWDDTDPNKAFQLHNRGNVTWKEV